MNTKQHKYFEFSEKNNDYYALIVAKSKDEAVSDYYEDVVGRDYNADVSCEEVPSSVAWHKLVESGLSDESTMEELVKQFDQSGLLLISADLM